MVAKLPDPLIGQTFGYLTVIAHLGSVKLSEDSKPKRRVTVRCRCGVEKSAVSYELRDGTTVSCGCFTHAPGVARSHGYAGTGERRSKLYRAWNNMLARVKRPDYVERGITACERWLSFVAFADDIKQLGECPRGFSLDRIDNDGHYQPGNVRWASRKTQQNNTSANIVIEVDGIRRTITQWAEAVGLTRQAISVRLRNGWSERDAVTLAPSKRPYRNRPKSTP